MAAAKVYNPPPNWPPPPPGWQPPPDWVPDPSWGAAPEGWRLYERVNPHPFLRSLGIASAVFVVALVILQLSAEVTAFQAGDLFSRIALIPALATGLLLRTRRTRWPWWKVLLSVLAWAALFGALGVVSD